MSALTLLDVGPRDGLQNEKTILPTEARVELIRGLLAAGLRRIEAVSFVHPAKVPQMAEAEAVIAGLRAQPLPAGTSLIGLVLNEKGAARALAAGVDEIGFTLAVSDSFGMRNQGMAAAAALDVLRTIAPRARAAGKFLSVILSTCFRCPFEGEIAATRVLEIAAAAAEAGAQEIALADTIGAAAPAEVSALFAQARQRVPQNIRLRGHFHDTRGLGAANSWAAYQAGAEVLDASIGGLGGCPFAPGATGNVATEDLVFMFQRSGLLPELDLSKLITLARGLEGWVGHKPASALARAGGFPA